MIEDCFVLFLRAKGIEAKHMRLSRQTVRNCVQNISEGRTSIEDERRVGLSVEIATSAKEIYVAVLQGLVKWWDKCLNMNGYYVC
jgi:hypothetical protein